MVWFRILLAVAAVVAAVVVYFFAVGIADGSVSSFNAGLWLAIIIGVVAVLAGGVALNAKGRRGAAMALLAILAVPGLLFGLFVLLLLVTQPRWN
jgi:hypothetical protein